jgi:hypothetical protein
MVVVCAVAAVAGHRQQGKSRSGREQFVGAWKLVSAVEYMKDGSSRNYSDVGPNGKGYLIYTADGHMCAELMRGDRGQWKDVFNPTDAEKIAAFDSFSSYCGRYEVDEEKHLMRHMPETASLPDFVRTSKQRLYVLSGETLTFAAEDTDPGVKSYKIVWQKARS